MSKPQKAILKEKEKATPKPEYIPTPKAQQHQQQQEFRSMARTSDFIDDARTANKKIWDGINELKALQREWNALDYGNTLPDGEAQNAGITRAAVGAVVFDTANAFETVLNAGNATNMAKLL